MSAYPRQAASAFGLLSGGRKVCLREKLHKKLYQPQVTHHHQAQRTVEWTVLSTSFQSWGEQTKKRILQKTMACISFEGTQIAI